MSELNRFKRLIFGIVILLFCGIVALRPIPDEQEEGNDTGRYVVRFQTDSEKPFSLESNESMSWKAFNILTRPASWTKSEQVFLFLTGLAVPFAIYLFGTRNHTSLALSFAYLFSVASLELMTNALRQGCSVFFLLAAIYYGNKFIIQLIMTVLAILLHDSAVIFIGLLLILKFTEVNHHKWRLAFIYSILTLVIFYFFISDQKYIYSIEHTIDTSVFVALIQEKYLEVPSPWYLLYMVSPVYLIFCIRLSLCYILVSREEWVTFVYLNIVFILSYLYFPYITYRFAITGTVIQLFVAMRATDKETRAENVIFYGMMAHTLTFVIFSTHITKIFFGV